LFWESLDIITVTVSGQGHVMFIIWHHTAINSVKEIPNVLKGLDKWKDDD